MRLLTLIFFMSLAVPCFGQGRHPFTFEDMMKLKRVADPEVSPDGKWVIFTVVDVDLDANAKTPHVWVVSAAGGQEREIIADQDASRPRWAPDGNRFAFVSYKEGSSQVWIADFDRNAGTVTGVHRLTSIASQADGEQWSPDGRSILFVSNVYPDCPDEACNSKRLEEAAKSQVKALIFTRLLFRHVNAYTEGLRSHIFVIPVDACGGATTDRCPAGAVQDLTPGDYDAQDDFALSPDGREICYTSNHDKDQAASTNNDLWIVPLTGSPAKNITENNPASDSTPVYSPDGRYIAYRTQGRPGYESDRFRLTLYDRKTGKKENLTENFDRWVGTFNWAPNSRELYFIAENKGASPIFSIGFEPKAGGLAVSIAPRISGFNGSVAITRDGNKLVFTRMSLGAPPEVYVATTQSIASDCVHMALEDASGCAALRESALTHINDLLLSQVSMSPLESFWFTGAHGDKVQGFVVKPPNFDARKKYPLKFFLKGGPQIAWGDLWSYASNFELLAANGYVVITINFHGSTGYGQSFVDSVNGDWGGAPFEDEMKGLDYAEKAYPYIDKNRECAIGSSYGGYMANWILGHTDRFKCVVSHHSVFNAESFWGSTDELWFPNWDFKGTPYSNPAMYEKWSPQRYAKNFKTPTLVIHGQRDYRLDVSQAFELFTTLQVLGVPSKMLYFPDEAQNPGRPQNSRLWYKTVNDWVDQWTK